MADNRFIEESTQNITDKSRTQKIVFLDIDGVINDGLGSKFAPDAIRNVIELCKATGAKIVICSDWRINHLGKTRDLKELKELFPDLEEYMIGCTPISPERTRGGEIESWLIEHSNEINSFVILDDFQSDYESRFGNRHVHCKKLFSDNSLLEQARTILTQPLAYENSEAVQKFKAIVTNSMIPHCKKITFSALHLSILRRHYGWINEKLITELMIILKNNTYITHLSLLNLRQIQRGSNELSEMNQITKHILEMIKATKMPLEYLMLDHFILNKFISDDLLKIIDGQTLHIDHLSFNGSGDPEKLATWIKHYPRSITLELDTWGLEKPIEEALQHNQNVKVILSSQKVNLSK